MGPLMLTRMQTKGALISIPPTKPPLIHEKYLRVTCHRHNKSRAVVWQSCFKLLHLVMSRIPPSPSRTPSKPKSLIPSASRLRPTPSNLSVNAATPTRIRTKSATQSPARNKQLEEGPPIPKASINIKEAIALKRAEAKKANLNKPAGGHPDDFTGLEDADPNRVNEEESVDELGRLSLKDTIERARSTGEYTSI